MYPIAVVIDLSRKPVFINADVCPGWFVVRTASKGEVNGVLRRKLEKNEHRRGRGETRVGEMVVVAVEASVPRGTRRLMEVRLPVNHILNRRPKDPMCNPFEVATSYVDAFSKTEGSWRAQLIVELIQNANGDLWVVTVRDESTRMDLVSVTMKEIDEDARGRVRVSFGQIAPKTKEDLLPLQRLTMKESHPVPMNVWERLRAIDYNPALEPDDEAP